MGPLGRNNGNGLNWVRGVRSDIRSHSFTKIFGKCDAAIRGKGE